MEHASPVNASECDPLALALAAAAILPPPAPLQLPVYSDISDDDEDTSSASESLREDSGAWSRKRLADVDAGPAAKVTALEQQQQQQPARAITYVPAQRDFALYRWYPFDAEDLTFGFVDLPYRFHLDLSALYQEHTVERYVSFVVRVVYGVTGAYQGVKLKDARDLELPLNYPVELLMHKNQRRMAFEDLRLVLTAQFKHGPVIKVPSAPVHVWPHEVTSDPALDTVTHNDCSHLSTLTHLHTDLVSHYPHPVYVLWIALYSSGRARGREVYHRLPVATTLTLRQALLKHLPYVVPATLRVLDKGWFLEDVLHHYHLDMNMLGSNFLDWYYDHYVSEPASQDVGIFRLHVLPDQLVRLHQDVYRGPRNRAMPPLERFEQLCDSARHYFAAHYHRVADKHRVEPVADMSFARAAAPVPVDAVRFCGACRRPLTPQDRDALYCDLNSEGLVCCHDCYVRRRHLHLFCPLRL